MKDANPKDLLLMLEAQVMTLEVANAEKESEIDRLRAALERIGWETTTDMGKLVWIARDALNPPPEGKVRRDGS